MLRAQCRHECIHFAGGDAADVSLDDHAVEGLIDSVSVFEDRGQASATAHLEDNQFNVADLSRQGPLSVAVAVTHGALARESVSWLGCF